MVRGYRSMDRNFVTIFKNNEMIRFETPNRITKATAHVFAFLVIISPLIFKEKNNIRAFQNIGVELYGSPGYPTHREPMAPKMPGKVV